MLCIFGFFLSNIATIIMKTILQKIKLRLKKFFLPFLIFWADFATNCLYFRNKKKYNILCTSG